MSNLRKLPIALGVAGSVAVLAGSAAAAVGPDAAVCSAGKPSIDVRVVGFKQASGTVKVALYDEAGFLKHGTKLRKVVVPVLSAAPLDICIAVPAPGRYAVTVHHDVNGNGGRDWSDGGGFSRNPSISLWHMRPSFSQTVIEVGNGPRAVAVQLLYRHGLSIGPTRG